MGTRTCTTRVTGNSVELQYFSHRKSVTLPLGESAIRAGSGTNTFFQAWSPEFAAASKEEATQTDAYVTSFAVTSLRSLAAYKEPPVRAN